MENKLIVKKHLKLTLIYTENHWPLRNKEIIQNIFTLNQKIKCLGLISSSPHLSVVLDVGRIWWCQARQLGKYCRATVHLGPLIVFLFIVTQKIKTAVIVWWWLFVILLVGCSFITLKRKKEKLLLMWGKWKWARNIILMVQYFDYDYFIHVQGLQYVPNFYSWAYINTV